MKAIGARGSYTECSSRVSDQFSSSGDGMPPVSFHFQNWTNLPAARSLLPALSKVVKSGVTTVLYAGDADGVCNWMGGLACANAVEYGGHHVFKDKEVKNYTVNGEVVGTFKKEGGLNWLRVFGSGHYVAFFSKPMILK
jgi:carboxypeptidase C (cathepsin A)